jgi:uncharacterized protein YbjQ (UPF0145 family)
MSGQHKITDVSASYRGWAFTSDLSARGLWFMFDKNFEPVGMVSGNCAYSVGTFHPWALEIKGSFHGEFRKRFGVARVVALARMQFQADELGADGIIGIHSKVEHLHNGKWMEVTLSGTAVRYMGRNPYTPSRLQEQEQEQEQVLVSSNLPHLQPASR